MKCITLEKGKKVQCLLQKTSLMIRKKTLLRIEKNLSGKKLCLDEKLISKKKKAKFLKTLTKYKLSLITTHFAICIPNQQFRHVAFQITRKFAQYTYPNYQNSEGV